MTAATLVVATLVLWLTSSSRYPLVAFAGLGVCCGLLLWHVRRWA